MTLEPIGIFRTDSKFPYEARRQASVDHRGVLGEIHLHGQRDFEQALQDLEGFERIWIIYQFHHNSAWKPKVMPPRGPRVKRGVFATRAPYRPNAIGQSCVKLLKVDGLRVIVQGHDLLDGTPILDIKPYLPYADAFPEAKVGWIADIDSTRWQVLFSNPVRRQLVWLAEQGLTQLQGFIESELEFDPLDAKRKRLERLGEVFPRAYRLAYRTWRVNFSVTEDSRKIHVTGLQSGYTASELAAPADPYGDKVLHRQFQSLIACDESVANR